jgi:hypothetical protein
MDGSDVVIVESWRSRQPGESVREVSAAQLADVMEGMWKARRRATAHRSGRFDDGEVGGVVPHPDTGRLVWWAELPDDDEDDRGIG